MANIRNPIVIQELLSCMAINNILAMQVITAMVLNQWQPSAEVISMDEFKKRRV